MLPLVAKVCSTDHSVDKIFLNIDFFFFFFFKQKQTTDLIGGKVRSIPHILDLTLSLLYLCYRALIIGAKIFLLGNFISFVFPL